MRRLLLALALAAPLAGCAQVDETLNRFQRTWDNSPKTITLYSLDGTPVRTYDIGRAKVTRAEDGGEYIYFYVNGKYVQTSLPYVVESK